jgi:hypothetical protein
MVNIYLDDLRSVPNGFLLAKNAIECQRMLIKYKGRVNILSLDHDLGDDENNGTGYDVVKWLCLHYQQNNDNYFPKSIYLHSANPVGRTNMYHLLKRYKPNNVKMYNSPILYVE